MDGRPSLNELERNYGFKPGIPVWPTTVNVRQTPIPGVRGFVGWGSMVTGGWLGELAAASPDLAGGLGELIDDADFQQVLRDSLGDDPEDDRAAAEILASESDLGIVPAIIAAGVGIGAAVAKAAGATAAITGVISAAGALASTTAAIVAGIVQQKKNELAAAKARGASPAELQKIRRKYGARKASVLSRSRQARRKLRIRMKALRKSGHTRKQARRIATKELKKRGGRRQSSRRKAMPRGAKTPEQISRETEDIAAGFSLATDIMRRTAAHVAETSGGYSVDPMTGERVRHRPVTEVTSVAVPPSAAPLAPTGPSIIARLRQPAFLGVPWWGVIVVGGSVVLLVLRKRSR